jgi:hypothetical protein
VTSNEREGHAGITVFGPGNRVLAVVNIEEPGLEFTPEAEEETIGNQTEEEVPEPNFPSDVRFNPTICLPVKLYPGSAAPIYTDPETNDVYELPLWNEDPSYVCAPLGAEGHARHPHGIDMDRTRGLVYQVIEHAGLKWNATRSGFEIAETTDGPDLRRHPRMRAAGRRDRSARDPGAARARRADQPQERGGLRQRRGGGLFLRVGDDPQAMTPPVRR